MHTQKHDGLTIGKLNSLMFGGDRYPIKALLGEISELLSAIWSGQWKEVRLEASQVTFDIQHVVYGITGKDFKPILCRSFVTELIHRHEWWIGFFRDLGKEFDPRWLRGGSNYRRPDKIEAAKKAAGLPGYDWDV